MARKKRQRTIEMRFNKSVSVELRRRQTIKRDIIRKLGATKKTILTAIRREIQKVRKLPMTAANKRKLAILIRERKRIKSMLLRRTKVL